MSKTWYPVIDYEKCIECGACTDMCKHGVYDVKKAPTPVVVKPEGCIQGCYGCGNLCPSEAISYVGDKTQKNDNCCCSCGDESGGCC
ncbi:MAG: 4Fe-4S binding protein [Clostridia bacterium]|nr:4Fe-4S binding protein [Clostridia bacterium]